MGFGTEAARLDAGALDICGSGLWSSGMQRRQQHADEYVAHHHKPHPELGGQGYGRDDHGDELRDDAGDEHGHVQRDDDTGAKLECDEHYDVSASWSYDGECGGEGGRGGQQWYELHGDNACAYDAHDHESETDIGADR